MEQGVLDAIADQEVCPKTQHSMNFGVTLRHDIPQEGGGFSVGLEDISLEQSNTKITRTENACPCKETCMIQCTTENIK